MSRAWPVAAFAGLAACGGGSGMTSSPTVANRAPVFTSGTAVSVVENSVAAAYAASATDADGDPLTYSLAGGADAARFSISSSGQLSFVASPNFDLPADADADNVYQVQIGASDGKSTTTQTVAVSVTNSKEGVAVRRIATGFTDPVAIAPVSDTAMLVAEKAGRVFLLDPQTGARTLLIQIADIGGVGVTALAASPTYSADGIFHAMYTTSYGYLVINRFKRNPAGPTVPDNSGPILGVSAPNYAGGGWLGYDATGLLNAATGDAGGSGDPEGSAQNINSRLGKLLHISATLDPYAGASPIFWLVSTAAMGLHQPNGGSLVGGMLVIADRGQDRAEELDLVSPGFLNFGWPVKEGTSTLRGTLTADMLDPVLEYPHGGGASAGAAIVGGAIGPTAVASLRNQYIFADRSGAIFAVSASAFRQGTTIAAATMERRDADFAPDVGTIDHPVAITPGPGGTLYMLDADGEIYRVEGS